MNKYLSFITLSLFFLNTLSFSIVAQDNVQPHEISSTQLESDRDQEIRPKVAVIYLMWKINFKETYLNLIKAAKNSEILGILLIIHNDGGAIDTFSALHDLTKKITTMKPIVGLIVGSAMSGGYIIASATNYIIAHSCSEVGQIGVASLFLKYKDPRKKGELDTMLAVEIFRAGEFKTIHSNYSKELSPREKEYIQENLNKYYTQFLEIVAHNRKLNVENYTAWADGKSFIASEALELGLIDEIGTVFEAENKMLELISKKNPRYTSAKDITPVFYEENQDEDK